MGNRTAALVVRSIPWLAALAYLSLVAQLGLTFHRIEPFAITQLHEHRQQDEHAIALPFVKEIEREPAVARLSMDFVPVEGAAASAIFIPRAGPDAKVSLNGVVIRTPWVSHRRKQINQPLLIPLPDQQLLPGQPNELLIELQGYGATLFVSSFYLGPQLQLEPAYRFFEFFRRDLIRIALSVTLMLAIFMGTIWMVRRQFNEYGWLSIAFFAFTYYLYNFASTTESPYFALQTWSFLLARAVFICSFVFFIHQFLSLRRRRLEMATVGFFGIVFAIGLLLVLGDRYGDFLTMTFFTSLPMVLLLIAYVCSLLVGALIRSGHVYLHWLLVGSLLGLLLGIHDLCVLFDAQHWLFRDFFISHYASLFMAIGFGGVLVHRVAHALFNSEDLNLELNRLLVQKSTELEHVARQRLQHEKQLALNAERQRIMADMHDGVGGQLVSLISANRDRRLDPPAVGRELDLILADLRLILDAMTPAGEDLIAALARLRERSESLFRGGGCQLHWSIDPGIEAIPMTPGQTVNVLRLVQEALQNCLKHAQAGQIWLQLEATDAGFELTIRDDGVGRSGNDARSPQGLGTQTMQRRAQALGGSLEIAPCTPHGTRVTLKFRPQPAGLTRQVPAPTP